jgi:hypothetical protein
MEMQVDTEIDPSSGLTKQEKYANFLTILRITRYLDDGGRITEDWMEEQKELILQYREWIPDYSVVNDEIEEHDFRKCCSETEILISHLCNSIRVSKTFSVNVYHIFMKHMKQIIEAVNTDEEMVELLSMLKV